MADYRQLVTWTSVDPTSIGDTNFHSTGTLSFEIPSFIPDNAIEVLIYVYLRSSSSSGAHNSVIKIYTEGEDGEEYAKYVSLIPGRSYYYIITENMWFPMPSSRRVFLNVPNSYSGTNQYVSLAVTGYR